ncbi:holo-ACP synthase [Paenibacillus sp. FJAT-26967]|uniref:holo-ACP synthase n=1 Tax=Paenibacillus sp. FJAT-26967 TaxID=1729690 RepID=UPI00083943AE|nr:holo-ACP synthase [Paenibacillus sp. FJAT-26967]
MIYGIGIDIQEIAQFEEIMHRQQDRFLRRIFTDQELSYCSRYNSPAQHLAARWAVKEAFLKAAGTGLRGGYRLADLEVSNLPSGKPELILHGQVREDIERAGVNVYISLSHSGDYAAGQVVLWTAPSVSCSCTG